MLFFLFFDRFVFEQSESVGTTEDVAGIAARTF